MASVQKRRLPELSNAGLKATANVVAFNEYNEPVDGAIAVERALTIYLDKREIVTLMTLGNHPELLILGWLRNQRLVDDIEAIKAIQVDWETESVAIVTHGGVASLDKKLDRKTVTTGCGQGTVFGDLMENIDEISLQQPVLKQSSIYALLNALSAFNEIYKNAGAVHGCALCSEEFGIEQFIEDVGRHNAVDAIAGYMWLNDIRGNDKLFYTTGRLTSEMVIKVALMQIPVLLSRSGITAMGLEIAQKVGVTLIARAKGRHFLVYHGGELIEYDEMPPQRPRHPGRDTRSSPD
ncbi:MAG: formate dehydrogenase accessory sulfurtransferase FdhD [Gammaproteobacteria bacterium]|nr:formate dehydrogenase accessory sulfurtransferase FdhD [Gammaproteobacteria bacterium]MDH3446625.1 formate dehydrogenase accessory sulfurtransferase FdhD [Gammaproteobacteria bacterium]